MVNESRRSLLRSRKQRTALAVASACLCALAGCNSTRVQVAQALGNNAAPPPVIREQSVEEAYHLASPDVIEIQVDGLPHYGGQFTIGPDGRISLEQLGNPRVEGQTSTTLAACIAQELSLPPERVRCRVVSHQSRVVFVHGPIEGGDRAVRYRGPENVVSFLRRCGGLKTGADLRDVYVVRGNVAEGSRPQVILVDLEAILLHGDARTNVLIEPFDEVRVGELSRSRVGKALPEWMRPVYRGFCGWFPWACPKDWRQQIGDVEP